MKKTLILLLISFGPWLVNAQQNIGYVDIQRIFYSLPDRMQAQQELDAFMRSLMDDLQALQFNYEQKLKEYEGLGADGSAAVRQSLEQKILSLEDQIGSFQQSSQSLIQAREEELMKPLHDKILAAVELVAKEKGYAHVFDTASALVFPAESEFTEAVLKRLGH